MTAHRRPRRWKTLVGAGLAATLAGLVGFSPQAAASTEKVAIYIAVCDGNGATDTVKIKKINEDGSGLTVVGDTTVPHCVPNSPADRYLSGLSVSGQYVYFSWINGDFNGAGIGRLKTDGSGGAEVNFVTAPDEASYFQMAPRSLDGFLYLYVHNGRGGPINNLRIMRANQNTGALSDCYTPSGSPTRMNIGVGKDAVYYATSVSNQKLYKVSSDCASSSVVSDFEIAPSPQMLHVLVDTRFESLASLVSESDDALFVYTKHAVNETVGLSQMSTSSGLSNFQQHLYQADDGAADSQVWGFNYLYFKDAFASKMFRVAPGGTPQQVFAEHITGILHHMSVVKETTVPATAPETPTPAAPVTKAPLTVSKKGVTSKQIVRELGLKTPKGSKISFAVAKKAQKFCTIKRNRVVATRAGKNCRITVTVTPKKGKAIKRTAVLKTS
jgi:hypothetical protein